MKYTVLWARDAEKELAAIWMATDNRGMIAEAADSLDRQLTHNPDAIGESRPHKQRVAYCLPLGIRFQIFNADRIVRVLAVWACRPRAK